MIQRIIAAFGIVMSLCLVLVPATAFAYDPIGGVCSSETAHQSALCQGEGDTSQDPLTGQKGLIRGIANILAIVTGIGAVITIIVSGARLIGSNGDANQAKAARGAIVAALIGIVIIVLADSIIGFVLGRI